MNEITIITFLDWWFFYLRNTKNADPNQFSLPQTSASHTKKLVKLLSPPQMTPLLPKNFRSFVFWFENSFRKALLICDAIYKTMVYEGIRVTLTNDQGYCDPTSRKSGTIVWLLWMSSSKHFCTNNQLLRQLFFELKLLEQKTQNARQLKDTHIEVQKLECKLSQTKFIHIKKLFVSPNSNSKHIMKTYKSNVKNLGLTRVIQDAHRRFYLYQNNQNTLHLLL